MAAGEVVRQIYLLVNLLSSFLLPPSAFDFVLACRVDHPSPMMDPQHKLGGQTVVPHGLLPFSIPTLITISRT